jgi:hypothetical protein
MQGNIDVSWRIRGTKGNRIERFLLTQGFFLIQGFSRTRFRHPLFHEYKKGEGSAVYHPYVNYGSFFLMFLTEDSWFFFYSYL